MNREYILALSIKERGTSNKMKVRSRKLPKKTIYKIMNLVLDEIIKNE